jgi:flagellar motor switch protein FliG
MGVTDRHKRPGAFKKLVNSLEMTAPDRRIKILESFKVEDPEFAQDVENCIFDFAEFTKLNDLMLCEFISHITDFKALAMALYKAPEEILNRFKKNMPVKQQLKMREESELIEKLTVAEQMSARFKLIEIARDIEREGKIKLKPYNDKYPAEE